VDGLAKYLSGSYSPLFLAWARYAVASVIVLPMVAMTGKGSRPAGHDKRRGYRLDCRTA
jgi:hypothetical protein